MSDQAGSGRMFGYSECKPLCFNIIECQIAKYQTSEKWRAWLAPGYGQTGN